MAITEIEVEGNRKIIDVDGTLVAIQLSDDGDAAHISEAQWSDEEEDYIEGELIGSFDFVEAGDGFLISGLNISSNPKYRRKGIGREALKFHKEYFARKIFAQQPDGQTYDDGRHLTGDGPSFVAKMQEEGIVEPFPDFTDEQYEQLI